VLGTETPSYTAFTNVLILFSSVRLGVPSSFYPFVLYRLKQPDLGAQYASDLVLRNRRYGDVAVDDSTPLFMSDNFELVENDLIPFFDSATFPSLHSYPLVFLKTRNLPVVRVLGEQTEVTFFSRVPRSVRVNLKFDKQLPAPTAVPFQLDDLTSSLRLDDAGSAVSDPMSMRPGLHRLRLGPVPSRAWVSRLQIDPAAGSR
jgi:hypothetical protein